MYDTYDIAPCQGEVNGGEMHFDWDWDGVIKEFAV